MEKETSYAEGPILEATSLPVNCQIDLIQLEPGSHGQPETRTGRFTMADLPGRQKILLLRVNNNHYHSTVSSSLVAKPYVSNSSQEDTTHSYPSGKNPTCCSLD